MHLRIKGCADGVDRFNPGSRQGTLETIGRPAHSVKQSLQRFARVSRLNRSLKVVCHGQQRADKIGFLKTRTLIRRTIQALPGFIRLAAKIGTQLLEACLHLGELLLSRLCATLKLLHISGLRQGRFWRSGFTLNTSRRRSPFTFEIIDAPSIRDTNLFCRRGDRRARLCPAGRLLL